MKKLELILGIALFIITTVIVVMFPFVVPYSNSNLALICILSLFGYLGGYLYIDMYLDRHQATHYTKGYREGYSDGCDDSAADVRNVFKNNKSSKDIG